MNEPRDTPDARRLAAAEPSGTRSPERALTLPPDQAGATLAAVLRELLPGTSWSKVRDLCRDGRARVNGEPETDSARRLEAGDQVEVGRATPGLRVDRPHGPVSTAEILVHLDADVAVARKPAGLLTVPFHAAGTEKDTLLSRARVAARRLDAARGVDHGPSLRVVQRIDKDTSGLVVFARTVAAQRRLQEQLAEHTVTRRYLALVHGHAEDAIYDTLLVPDRGDGIRGSWGSYRRAALPVNPPKAARQAVTHVRVKERLRGATLVTCELETGRQHQIRIHLAEAGFPLVGETVYIRDYAGPRIAAPRPMLHAAVLGFAHPRTGKAVRYEDPPPADFNAVLARLRR